MIRTQIQLTEAQFAAVREMAARERVSVAELVRRGIDALLRGRVALDRDARVARALAVAGRYRSGMSNVSERHDDHSNEEGRQPIRYAHGRHGHGGGIGS